MDTTTLAVFGVLAFLALVAMWRFGDKLDLSLKGPGGMGIDIKGERKWQPQQASSTYRRPSPLARIHWGRLMGMGVILALAGGAFVYRDTLMEMIEGYNQRDISIEWDERTFLLRNTSGKTLNLSEMYYNRYINYPCPAGSFYADCPELDVFWLREFNAPLSQFEPDMCLQAWTYETSYPPSKPSECASVYTLTIASAEKFWGSLIGIDEEGAPESLCTNARGATSCKFDVPDYLVVSG